MKKPEEHERRKRYYITRTRPNLWMFYFLCMIPIVSMTFIQKIFENDFYWSLIALLMILFYAFGLSHFIIGGEHFFRKEKVRVKVEEVAEY